MVTNFMKLETASNNKAILQNVTFQEDADEYAANDTDQFDNDDQEVITR